MRNYKETLAGRFDSLPPDERRKYNQNRIYACADLLDAAIRYIAENVRPDRLDTDLARLEKRLAKSDRRFQGSEFSEAFDLEIERVLLSAAVSHTMGENYPKKGATEASEEVVQTLQKRRDAPRY